MQDMLNALCPLCGADAYKIVWRWPGVSNGYCARCAHSYSVVAASASAEYQGFEQKYPVEYLLDRSNVIFEIARRRVKHLPRHSGSILEIGCGYCYFL